MPKGLRTLRPNSRCLTAPAAPPVALRSIFRNGILVKEGPFRPFTQVRHRSIVIAAVTESGALADWLCCD